MEDQGRGAERVEERRQVQVSQRVDELVSVVQADLHEAEPLRERVEAVCLCVESDPLNATEGEDELFEGGGGLDQRRVHLLSHNSV